jgi:hypothetical protein
MRLLFDGCDPDFVRNVCHAQCEHPGKTSARPLLIPIQPWEVKRIRELGATVVNNLIQPVHDRCPFSLPDGLCGLHHTQDKPWGCWSSPFVLNSHRTMIIANWFKMLVCFKAGRKLPAYQAFRSSLDRILGLELSAQICDHLDAGGGDLIVTVPPALLKNFERMSSIMAAQRARV